MAVENYEKGQVDYETMKVLESATVKERANLHQAEEIQLESKKERTGATHLVHCWYPKGHNVSQWIFAYTLLTGILEADGPIC